MDKLAVDYGTAALAAFEGDISELISDGLLEKQGSVIRLTVRGRLLSNEVFERFISINAA